MRGLRKRQFSSSSQSAAWPQLTARRPNRFLAGERCLKRNWLAVVDVAQPWSHAAERPELGRIIAEFIAATS
jgi:hypothetical protein